MPIFNKYTVTHTHTDSHLAGNNQSHYTGCLDVTQQQYLLPSKHLNNTITSNLSGSDFQYCCFMWATQLLTHYTSINNRAPQLASCGTILASSQ